MARLNPGTRIYGTGTVDSTLFLNGGINSTNTQTGSLVALGGIGVGGAVQANQLVATNLSGAASTSIDAKVANGNYSLNFLARVGAGSYNPAAQQDDSLIYWTNNSQGFGNLMIAPWSTTATGVRITNTGTVQLPSGTTATSTASGALVVTGGAAIGQNLIVGNQILVGQSSYNNIGVVGAFIAAPSIILGGQTTDSLYMRRQGTGNYAFQTYNAGNAGNVTFQPYGGNVTIGGNATVQSSNITVSTLTGMLVVADGVGIGGNLAVNGPIYLGNLGTLFAITTATSANGVAVRVSTPAGRVDIGAQNTSYAHFDTDRNAFWFNKRIEAGANVVGSFNGDLTIDRASSTISRIRITNGLTVSDQPFSVNTNTASASTLSGALLVSGGVGVGDSVYAGNKFGWSTASTSVAYQMYNFATNTIDTVFG